MNEKNIPMRMCIICKGRLAKKSLRRFQIKDGVLKIFEKSGRSFYICEACLNKNQQKIIKTINKKYNLTLSCENDENFKETISDG
ncbi:MAG: DUF448 domain-containing protein [Campylobacteraceae bacterium]|jgi:predicted RNA-binding protein YlxR (DUF448 family)|nr:DUF448 domain-containing protein [Campylobacteraceae bacterium]